MPANMEVEIAERAAEVGSGRAGRSRTATHPEWFATYAHVCWNFTDYPIHIDEAHERFKSMSNHEKRDMREMPKIKSAQNAERKSCIELLNGATGRLPAPL
jgi:hypothetical protein